MFIFAPIYTVNRLTFVSTAYYYDESLTPPNNHQVQLSQAPDAPVLAELQLEAGDGDNEATGEATVHACVGVPSVCNKLYTELFNCTIIYKLSKSAQYIFILIMHIQWNHSVMDIKLGPCSCLSLL